MGKELKNNVLKKQFDAGVTEGRRQAFKEVLDLLGEKYMNPANKRGSDRAEAILTVAREVGKYFQEHK